MIFVIICAFLLPLFLMIMFSFKVSKGFKIILLGILTFTLFQLFLRIPLLQLVLPSFAWYSTLTSLHPYGYLAFLAISAALFEEIGRFIILKYFLKERLTVQTGVGLGIGHGGIEAILLVGISAIYTLLFTNQVYPTMTLFLSGLERFATLGIQIGLSVMVIKALQNKNISWLLGAIILHTSLDFFAPLAINLNANIYLVELGILLLGLVLMYRVFVEYRKEKQK